MSSESAVLEGESTEEPMDGASASAEKAPAKSKIFICNFKFR